MVWACICGGVRSARGTHSAGRPGNSGRSYCVRAARFPTHDLAWTERAQSDVQRLVPTVLTPSGVLDSHRHERFWRAVAAASGNREEGRITAVSGGAEA
jgi:hypothetical protein